MILYRVMLDAEDGVYCQRDGFKTEDAAYKWAYANDDYSDDRKLFVESYKVHF